MSDDYEAQAAEYIRQSGKNIHASDCATSNAPAMQPGPCDCDEVKVTQADRDEAASYLRGVSLITKYEMDLIINGDRDLDNIVQAFARHAAQARLEGVKMGLEAVSELLDDAAQSDCEHGVRWLNEKAASSYLHEYRHTAQAVQAIRALDSKAIVKGEA